jgi:hypothetical protein
LKPIEITLETSGCGRAWTNIQAGIKSSKHFPQTRLGKHYSRQKAQTQQINKKKNLGHIQNRWQELQSEFVFLNLDGKAVAPTTSVPEAQKAKQANKKNFRNMMAACLKRRLTLCSWKGASANRFSYISSFESQHQT